MKNKAICTLLVVVAIHTSVAGQHGKTVSDVPVTSAITDINSTGVAFDIQSDGLGPYRNNVTGVQSILQASGNYAWLLSTYDSDGGSAGRNALITLGPENQKSANAVLPSIWSSWGTHLEPVRLITHGVGCPLLSIARGNPIYCPLLVRFGPVFQSGKKRDTSFYRLDLAPGTSGFIENETQNVRVSCNAVNSSGNCSDWFVDSIPQGQADTNRVIAQLTLVTNYSQLTYEGTFYLTFHIHVTNP